MKLRDIQNLRQLAKQGWEAMQDWLWLLFMWLSILVNLTHIQDILATWADVSDWTTWLAALLVEAVGGLAFNNALTNLSVALESVGGKTGATKERRRQAIVYTSLAMVFGLTFVVFSAWANILWYRGAVVAGILAPVTTVVCAIMEATRRYEVKVKVQRVQAQQDAQKVQQTAQKKEQAALKSLTPAQRRTDIALVLHKDAQKVQQLATRYDVHRTTITRDLNILAQQGKVKPDGGAGLWIATK